MKSYKDITALVTGASSGIGLALARSLARRGAHLIVTARSSDQLDELVADVTATGARANAFPSDLSEPGAAQSLYEAIKEAGLVVDLLINNAGHGRWGEFDRDDYARMLQLNINALTELCHLFPPGMMPRERVLKLVGDTFRKRPGK